MNTNETKVYNVLSYIGPLFIVGLLAKPGNSSVRFHANQGLVLFLAEIVCSIVLSLLGLVLGLIPILGVILTSLLSLAVGLVTLLFMIYGIRNALVGADKELPYIGHLEFIH